MRGVRRGACGTKLGHDGVRAVRAAHAGRSGRVLPVPAGLRVYVAGPGCAVRSV